MEGNELICTVGLPHSGKSTWARSTGLPIINPDAIRLAIHGQAFFQQAEPLVWALAQIQVRSSFLAGHKRVIVDATNIDKSRRAMWVSKDWATSWVEFHTGPGVCIERAIMNNRPDLVPIIERMATAYEPIDSSGHNVETWHEFGRCLVNLGSQFRKSE